jgi:hypothetical protein
VQCSSISEISLAVGKFINKAGRQAGRRDGI